MARGIEDLVSHILAAIRRNRMIRRGDRVLVAVSGGPDSVALLHALVALWPRLGCQLHVAHLDHQLRGRSSRADAAFVSQLALDYGLPCTVGRADVRTARERRGGSLEAVARDMRYGFLRRTARRYRANVVALGHTADDKVETFLLNLFRGAGLRGLAAIPAVRVETNLRIVRPLLDVRRRDVMAYLASHRVGFREDRTNRDVRFARNRIRHRLIPYLRQQFGPAAVEHVLMATAHLAEAQAAIAQRARLLVRRAQADNAPALRIAPLRRAAPAVQAEALQQFLRSAHGLSATAPLINALRQLFRRRTSGSLDMGRGLHVWSDGESLRFEHAVGSAPRRPRSVPLAVPGRTVWRRGRVQVEIDATLRPATALQIGAMQESTQPLGPTWRSIARGDGCLVEAWFDADRLKGPLVLRARKAGDRIRPAGLSGRKSIKKLFIDEKVPRLLRDDIPLLCRDDVVVWVLGYRVAETFRVTEATREVVCLSARLAPAVA